jgi:hypothetical protein
MRHNDDGAIGFAVHANRNSVELPQSFWAKHFFGGSLRNCVTRVHEAEPV